MWHSRTFWRLFGTFGVLVLFSVIVLGALTVSRFERRFLQQIEESLRTKAILIREVARDVPAAQLQDRVCALRDEVVTRITLIAGDGRVLADTDEDPAQMENHADRPEVREAAAAGFGSAVRFSDTLKQSMMYVALRVRPGAGEVGYVRVALPLEQVQAELAGLRRVAWTTAAVTGFGVLVLALWPARRLAQPLRDLTRRAERLAAGEPVRKIYSGDSGEVGALARTFNRLSDRLSEQVVQLETERQQLRAILGGMVEGVVALDGEQRVLFANERAAQLLEFQSAETTGRKFWEVVRQRALHDLVQKTLAGADAGSQDLAWTGQASRSLTVRAARLSGPRAGAVLVFQDTTELRRLERLRQEFFANVSHELKTPLAVVKACLETLADGAAADPEFGKRFLDRATHNADRLQALIHDLLSLARIEAGEEVFDFRAVALGEVVADCVERQRDRAGEKRLVLETAPPADEVTAWADEEAVRQILDNLVDNALKYTPDGGRVQVRWGKADGEAWAEVADTGVGIPEADLPRVFERFYRVDKARSRELGGTGLGLAIVKHLAQAMRGSASAASRVGEGSTFTVRLPRAPST